MANKKDAVYPPYMGKRLTLIGLVLLLTGILRLYNVDWSVVLMLIGAFLLIKGLIIKTLVKK